MVIENFLVIGGGGREHALIRKIAENERVHVFAAPGNAGTGLEERVTNVPYTSHRDLIRFAKQKKATVIVGPEALLVAGIVDDFEAAGHDRIFGPRKNATDLEGSKIYSCNLMNLLDIPQAESVTCYSSDEALKAISKKRKVFKLDRLAQGKGVAVYRTADEARAGLGDFVEQFKPFEGEQQGMLVAECLEGPEYSVFGFCDGNTFVPIRMAFQDHKLVFEDGHVGPNPNTGGMGAYGPCGLIPDDALEQTYAMMNKVVQGMAEAGTPYTGFLYAGMILTKDGPKVIEFNIRFGDPECQPAMMMIKSDLCELLDSALRGELKEDQISFKPGGACCVVMTALGYPGKYKGGLSINGIDRANRVTGVKVFHAGTAEKRGELVTSGGRILGVTGYSPLNVQIAVSQAYKGVDEILRATPDVFHCRRDIAGQVMRN